jgi:hypothetical protein
VVEDKLALCWSPQQIAGWRLPLAFPEDPEMRVSHETIYLSLSGRSRGALRRELQRCLQTGRAMRYPRGKRLPHGRGQLRDVVLISERPAEAEDRAVPGHWEGDLLLGKRPSAVVTLVERASRYVTLVALPDGYKAEQVRPALAAAVAWLVVVYFCDPRSPGSVAATRTPTASSANTSPKAPTCASSIRPRWTRSPPSSTAGLDKPWASRHPHRSLRRRCTDPLRPPPFLRRLDWW